MPYVAILGSACIAIGTGSQSFSVHVSLLFQKGGVLLKWHRQVKKLLWFLSSWSCLVLIKLASSDEDYSYHVKKWTQMKQHCRDTIVYLHSSLLSVVIYQDVWMRYREAWLAFGLRVWNHQGPSQVYESTWILGGRQLTDFRRRPLPALRKLNSLVVQECSFVQVCVAQEQNQKHGQTHWWAMGLSFSFKQIGRWQKTKHAHALQT